jgi:hypothetical protein
MAQATEASPLSGTTSFRSLVGFLGTSHFWPQILAGPKSLIGDKNRWEARHLECPLM